MAAAASGVRRRVAVLDVEILTAVTAIGLSQIDKTRALLVPTLLAVHNAILAVLTL